MKKHKLDYSTNSEKTILKNNKSTTINNNTQVKIKAQPVSVITPTPVYKAYYVTDFDTMCGNATEENRFLTWCQSQGINSLYFYNLNIVKCGKCGFASFNYSPYNILCLPIKGVSATQSIYECLDSLYSRELLDCDYKCDKCKNTAGNTIEKKMLTKPQTLCICFKRFEYKSFSAGINIRGMGGMSVKKNTRIDYPMILNIGKYYPGQSGKANDNVYKLVGVVNHVGNVNFGHYYSYCYDNELQSWLNFNDSNITPIDISTVLLNPAAYMLFYEKVDAVSPVATI